MAPPSERGLVGRRGRVTGGKVKAYEFAGPLTPSIGWAVTSTTATALAVVGASVFQLSLQIGNMTAELSGEDDVVWCEHFELHRGAANLCADAVDAHMVVVGTVAGTVVVARHRGRGDVEEIELVEVGIQRPPAPASLTLRCAVGLTRGKRRSLGLGRVGPTIAPGRPLRPASFGAAHGPPAGCDRRACPGAAQRHDHCRGPRRPPRARVVLAHAAGGARNRPGRDHQRGRACRGRQQPTCGSRGRDRPVPSLQHRSMPDCRSPTDRGQVR